MQLIFCKDNANERNENLFSNCRVQLIFCKDTTKSRESVKNEVKSFRHSLKTYYKIIVSFLCSFNEKPYLCNQSVKIHLKDSTET